MRAVQTVLRRDRAGVRNEPWFLAALLLAIPLTSSLPQSTGQHPDRRFVDFRRVAAVTRVGGQAPSTHPNPRYVVEEIPVSSTISLVSRPSAASARATFGAATVRIGTENGPDETIFGRIGAIATTTNGIIITDRTTQDLRVFDFTGRFRQRVGRRGAGPGEFRAPQAILIAPNQEMWVTDMQRRLTVFAPGPDGYKLSRTIPVDVGIRSMCAMGSELFANAVSIADLFGVRVMDSTARILRAFGKVYTSPYALVNYQFSEGLVACDATNRLVVYAPSAALGEVRAYSADGRSAWRTALEGVARFRISEDGSTVSGSPEGAHELLALHVVPALGVIVQYGHRTLADLRNNAPPSRIVTLLLDPKTGVGEVLTESWPRLAVIRGDHAIAVLEDPVPRLEIRPFRVIR